MFKNDVARGLKEAQSALGPEVLAFVRNLAPGLLVPPGSGIPLQALLEARSHGEHKMHIMVSTRSSWDHSEGRSGHLLWQ